MLVSHANTYVAAADAKPNNEIGSIVLLSLYKPKNNTTIAKMDIIIIPLILYEIKIKNYFTANFELTKPIKSFIDASEMFNKNEG